MTDGQYQAESPANGGTASDGCSIFFSYSRHDQSRAIPIIAALEGAGYRVWWDGLLEGGERFSRTTTAALERAQAVVVLWSPTSIESHWVHDEATRGRDRGCLVPISIDGAEPPLGFRQFQVIACPPGDSAGQSDAIGKLIRAVAALHGDGAQRPPHATPIAPVVPNRHPNRRPSRRMMIAGGGALAVGAVGASLWATGIIGGSGIAPNSIAVLPFANLSRDPAQAYFSEGLSAELRSALSRNRALLVMGSASSDQFRGAKADQHSIARTLRVAYLLDGSVRVADGMVRIAIDLVEAASGFNRLSRNFDQPMGNVLAIQREIAAAVTAELTAQVGAKKGKTLSGGTENVAAYDHYLRGKELYNSAEDEAGERAALAQFDAAIAADARFASAHAARSRSLTTIANQYGSPAEIPALQAAALASAQHAVALAPDLADAQSTLALTYFQGQLNVRAARQPYDRSRSLGDGDAPVLARFALYCAATGRDADAMPAMARALTIDPLNALMHRGLGTVQYAAGRYDNAIAANRAALGLNPKLSDTHARIGMAMLAKGDPAAAIRECAAETHVVARETCRAIAHRRLGQGAAANAALAALKSEKAGSLYQQAQIAAQAGDPQSALGLLQSARGAGDAGLIALRYDPMLAPLRPLPAFIQLLNAMGFA